MRTFLALPLTQRQRNSIDKWQKLAMPSFGRPVRAENLHVTLCFLGNTTPEQVVQLSEQIDDLPNEDFELRLDRVEFVPRNRLIWLGSETVPDALSRLVKKLRTCAAVAGISTESRRYRSHITLARDCSTRPNLDAFPLSITIPGEHLVLYESVQTRKGVRYVELQRWSH